jgi:hypothetical protein
MKVIENCLPKYLFQSLADTLMHKDVAWYYCSTAYEEETTLFGYSFHHTVLFNSKSNSHLCTFIEPLVRALIYENGDTIDDLMRIRVGLITVTQKPLVHGAHIDFEYPHKTGLLYINESDGDTIFYENRYDPMSGVLSASFIRDPKTKLKIQTRVPPEPNKLILFDGYQYHSSSTPNKTARRIVLNFNYTTKTQKEK